MLAHPLTRMKLDDIAGSSANADEAMFLAHPLTRMKLGFWPIALRRWRWIDLKAVEEKALEGQTPTRVRFGDRRCYSAHPLTRMKR